MSEPATLEAAGLGRRFGATTVLDRAYLRAQAGTITAIVGPNGAGKTTLFDCLSGAERADAGWVRLDGVDISGRSLDQRARLGLVRTFQHASLFHTLTVEENVLVAAENRRRNGTGREFLGLPDPAATAARALADRTIATFGLEGVRDVPTGRLPTGTLRLVEVARACATQPRALLLDEPASGLDSRETDALQRLLLGLAADWLAVIVIEHDLDHVADIADTVVVMQTGRVLAAGSADAVLARADVRDALGLLPGVTEGWAHR
jgi:branched-chain amino acid transport system ATP-binding protein